MKLLIWDLSIFVVNFMLDGSTVEKGNAIK